MRLFSWLVFLACFQKAYALHNGVILIPGIAGSALYSTLNQAVYPECSKHPITSPPTRLWASPIQALPPLSHQRCWAAKLKLEANISATCWDPLPEQCSVTYTPHTGNFVVVDPPGFLDGIEYLDTIDGYGVPLLKYFHDLIDAFRQVGYKDNIDLLGFSYDWRYPTWQLDYSKLKTLIENFVLTFPNRKVVLICHSLGCLASTRFLATYVDQDWVKKHVESLVSINGAYGGSHKSMRVLLSGNSDYSTLNLFGYFNISMIPYSLIRDTERSFGSMFNILPNPSLFGESTPAIIIKKDTTKKIAMTYTELQPNVVNYTLMDWWMLLPTELRPQVFDATYRMRKEGLTTSLAQIQVIRK